ncbi:hypothetical protein ACWEK5_41380 [Rhodococcus koreensis]
MSELLVVVDGDGNIKAAAMRLGPQDADAPEPSLEVRLRAGTGESVHTVALPDELRTAGSLAALDDYLVEVQGDQARLTLRRP